MSGDAICYLLVLSAPPLLAAATYLFFRRVVGERGRTGWPLLLAGNGMLLLVLLSLLLLAGETWYRFLSDATDGTAQTKISRRWFERNWKTNSFHVRDGFDYAMRRTDRGRRRVTFFGDSFTAGHGVRLGERFVDRIRRERPEWEIHAIAELGNSTEPCGQAGFARR